MRSHSQLNRLALPIDDVADQILELLCDNDTCVILGETGCGKSTQIPQICTRLRDTGQIAITQPRRVAAMSLAMRVSDEMGSKVGDKVGYRVRFEGVCKEDTDIIYMTDGMLLREAITDGLLNKYSVVIVDEAHERSLHTDVLLYTLRLAQKQRKDKGSNPLKIVIMSATMNADLFSRYFNAPIYLIRGRTFPVEVLYAEALDGDGSDYVYNVLVSILQAHEREPISDDILVFLTGREEIELTAAKLRDVNEKLAQKMAVFPLYAALKTTQQQKVFEPAPEGERKVILATNIAETSLTIPGVRIVIDSGKVKQKTFTAGDGIDVLRVERISKAQAAQRAGRAGRESSGKCYRVYSNKDFDRMQQSSVAEILRSNLSAVILELISMGLKNIKSVKLIEQPSAEMMDSAERQLKGLGAIRDSKNGKKLVLTSVGQTMAKFPVEPPLSKVLLGSIPLECTAEALTVISLLSSEELFLQNDEDSAQVIRRKVSSTEGDHVTMLNAFNLFKAEKKKESGHKLAEWASQCGLNIRSLVNAAKIRKQLGEIASEEGIVIKSCGVDRERLRKSLAIGLFMNACEYDNQKNAYRLLLSPSTLVRIHPSSVLSRSRPTHIVFSQLLKTTDLYAKDVSVIDKSWVEGAISEFKKTK
ncbi:let-355 [Pristionchus pacificus]|nr:let-355 [Pristionchus pacificus]